MEILQLRKVSEGVRPPTVPRVEERDSFLEQIRTKVRACNFFFFLFFTIAACFFQLKVVLHLKKKKKTFGSFSLST